MKKKSVTTDDLAIMVQKGFNDIDQRLSDTQEAMATKSGIERLEKTLDKLERVGGRHEERLEDLERDNKKIKDVLALN